MFNLFEAFSNRIEDQSREFEATLSRIGSRRLATIGDALPMVPAATPEPAGIEPVATELVQPTRGSKKLAKASTAFARWSDRAGDAWCER
ncbi:MAG TPA: hypothetical protein VGN82_05300 [Bosea sp. (in: a-proteobacteria)]|jgi:hypothetical protein|uniref:hypothetical protein n=1 Tax=Bosea sp. (in: a-proteobacteria) TaxID=1871050 RepID=UPI002E1489FC|nr:hypothetical protein [Bosea sp. (in: a-proteobacteria)]